MRKRDNLTLASLRRRMCHKRQSEYTGEAEMVLAAGAWEACRTPRTYVSLPPTSSAHGPEAAGSLLWFPSSNVVVWSGESTLCWAALFCVTDVWMVWTTEDALLVYFAENTQPGTSSRTLCPPGHATPVCSCDQIWHPIIVTLGYRHNLTTINVLIYL